MTNEPTTWNETCSQAPCNRGVVDSGSPEANARDRVAAIGFAETERRIAALTAERDGWKAKAEALASWMATLPDGIEIRYLRQHVASLETALRETREALCGAYDTFDNLFRHGSHTGVPVWLRLVAKERAREIRSALDAARGGG